MPKTYTRKDWWSLSRKVRDHLKNGEVVTIHSDQEDKIQQEGASLTLFPGWGGIEIALEEAFTNAEALEGNTGNAVWISTRAYEREAAG